ncbi:hypothetical protein [Paraburkholderia monticola]|uniref:hypothetical protein n=1 Tax=Paraburkholderia monticola TaxID=1399968 RepID=UPI00128FFD6D|nr:hypothetical protein [Paraburkholderia monticola]
MSGPKRYGTSAAHREDGVFCLYAEYEKLVAERDALRAVNRELHRRAHQIEAPRQQFKALLRQANDHWGDTWMHEFDRLVNAHQEIQAMFRELARVYEYPMDGQHMHSCMDSNVEFPREKHPGVPVPVCGNCNADQRS